MKVNIALISIFTFSITSLLCAKLTLAQNIVNKSAVILMYHHVSSHTPAATSISPKQFRDHMEYVSKNFNVISLNALLENLKADIPLQMDSMVITFDDGYANILQNAHPVMRELKLPYTVFINPARIGKEKSQLNWGQVKMMEEQGVQFANHTLDHLHMLNRLEDESEQAWLQRVWTNVTKAQKELESHLQVVPKWLAYPFGEFNEKLADKVVSEGYIGFGQHSGAVSVNSNFATLPRFPAAGIFSRLKSLKVKMNSLSMPIIKSLPLNPQRANGDTIKLSFSFEQEDVNTSFFQCYFDGEKIAFQLTDNLLTIDSMKKIPIGRSRVNCTAPSISHPTRYYWYSQPFFVPNSKGLFPD